jgi:curved DNA-binding protein CbpA
MNQQVVETFKKLYFGKRTGILTGEAGSTRRAVYFRSGFVVGAQSSRNEDRLGEVMMRHGRITKQQFSDASHFIKSGWKLGEILAELNIIDDEEIEAFVRLQLLDVACTQLISPPKRLAFSPLSHVEAFVEAPLSVADILMEAARRTPKVEKILGSLRKDERKLGFPKDPLKRFQDVNLKPEEAFVLSRIDGTQAAHDIFAVSPLSEEKTARTLYGLLAAGVIEPEGEAGGEEDSAEKDDPSKAAGVSSPSAADDRDREHAEVERLYQEFQFRDYWQVLGIERGASEAEVKAAFHRGAKRFHPDRFRRITDPEFQEKLSFVFRRINEAFETLSSAKNSASYRALTDKESQYEEAQRRSVPSTGDPRRDGKGDLGAAKELYRRAQSAYAQEEFWQAIQLSQQAIDMAPERAELYHLLGLALSKNPKWQKDAEKNLKIAANLDPWKSDYLIELGKLYRAAGLHLRATRTFEQARAIDPEAAIPED